MKKGLQALMCLFVFAVLAGCGGGGGGSGSKTPPPASVTVALTTSSITAEVIIGDNYQATVAGTWSGSNLGSNQVYLQVQDSADTFTTPAAAVAGAGTFSYALPLSNAFADGVRNGQLTVRACHDAQCAQPYTGASAQVSYQLTIHNPVVGVTIATPSIVEEVDLGDDYKLALKGAWSATYLGTNKVYLQVSDSAGTYVAPAVSIAPADYSFMLPLVAGFSPGPRSGILTVRACRDALCTQPYDKAVATVDYQLLFTRIAEWETHQRNAAHNGYVPITLDPSKFAKVWEWQRPASTDPIGGINPVATSDGAVYVTTDVYFSEGRVYSINEATGQLRWTVSLGTQPGLNPPAFHDGRIYVATTGHADTFLWSFDAADGSFKFKSPFSGQWPHVLAPTPYENQVFTNGGYYGGVIYAYDRLLGTSLWQSGSSGDDDMSTPAADKDNVYYHTGKSLMIWKRDTGELVAGIADPFATSSGYSYHGAPMLGSRNNVVSFAGSAFSGRASANVEQYDSRVLSSFSVVNKAWEWATGNAYLTQPALAGGVIYAGRNSPMSLDAIDETTGKVLWSWAPSAAQGDTEFHRNIVVTRNLLFVSTNAAIYAIDLQTHAPVWRYPVPGMMAISSNRTLYIAAGAGASNGKLIAVRLK